MADFFRRRRCLAPTFSTFAKRIAAMYNIHTIRQRWNLAFAEVVLRPGWPDWADFRPMGDCLLWAGFFNYRSSP
jgi:hypothetical protein